ncbi:hypothetical protein OROMI_003141 [Orobanche minor]
MVVRNHLQQVAVVVDQEQTEGYCTWDGAKSPHWVNLEALFVASTLLKMISGENGESSTTKAGYGWRGFLRNGIGALGFMINVMGPDCNIYSPMTNIEFAHAIQHPESEEDKLEVNFQRMKEFSRMFGKSFFTGSTAGPGLYTFTTERETAAFVQFPRTCRNEEICCGGSEIEWYCTSDDQKEIFLCQDSYGKEELKQVEYSAVKPHDLVVPYWKSETNLKLITDFGKPDEGFLKEIIKDNGEYVPFNKRFNFSWTQGANYEEKEVNKEAFRKYLEAAGDLDALTKVPVALYEQNDKPSSPTEFIQQKLGCPTVAEHDKPQAQVSDMLKRFNELSVAHQEQYMEEKEANKEAFRKYLEASGDLDAFTKVPVALREQNDKQSSATESIQQKRFSELSVAHQEQCMELEERKKSHFGQVSKKNEEIDQNDEGVSN